MKNNTNASNRLDVRDNLFDSIMLLDDPIFSLSLFYPPSWCLSASRAMNAPSLIEAEHLNEPTELKAPGLKTEAEFIRLPVFTSIIGNVGYTRILWRISGFCRFAEI